MRVGGQLLDVFDVLLLDVMPAVCGLGCLRASGSRKESKQGS